MRLHLYKRPCPSVRPSVGRSVRPSVMLSSKLMENGLLRIQNESDSAGRGKEGRGGRSDEKEEERGGRRDEEEGVTRRKEQRGE